MRTAGIDLRFGTAVTGFTVDGERVRAVETAAGPVEADLVVIGLGVRPNAELARAAGVGVGESGGIQVDDHLRTDTPHIWAAGDCVVVALGTHATKQGRVVGTNLAGGDAAFGGVLDTAITSSRRLHADRPDAPRRDRGGPARGQPVAGAAHDRAHAGAVAGPRRGRSRQPGEERVPLMHEPRAAHAAERHPRLFAAAGAAAPGLDGLTLCQRLKADPATAAMPLLALTAQAMKADIDQMQAAGFDAIMTRPLNVEQLLAEVDRLLRKGDA